MIEINHHGAVNGVTGSCHELSLTSDDSRSKSAVLIDCGLFQGTEAKGRSSAEDLAIDFSIAHIRAKIHQVSGYSAHAGQEDLLRFIEGIPVPPKEIRIVHGDDDAKATFKRELEARLPNTQILIPGVRPPGI
ncbi:MBL fold metallo-hydrolase RNA specificity domain-containing protein [Marinobacter sp. SBS5]|uniref:MBL fold metallo-hydrolase RNA specificity domain-containing protein n=1 Tax=Marinobacter sp. SBS5 TaxID=3401754 RepID=UPI003AACC6AB